VTECLGVQLYPSPQKFQVKKKKKNPQFISATSIPVRAGDSFGCRKTNASAEDNCLAADAAKWIASALTPAEL